MAHPPAHLAFCRNDQELQKTWRILVLIWEWCREYARWTADFLPWTSLTFQKRLLSHLHERQSSGFIDTAKHFRVFEWSCRNSWSDSVFSEEIFIFITGPSPPESHTPAEGCFRAPWHIVKIYSFIPFTALKSRFVQEFRAKTRFERAVTKAELIVHRFASLPPTG